MPRDTSTGEGGIESALSKDRDCSVSDMSDESVLLTSSQGSDRRTGKFWELRKTGLPFLPRPSLEGLPGAPVGSFLQYFFGTVISQLSQTSDSESRLVLGLRPPKLLPDDEGKLGKYGLCEGERGLVGGVSKGEESAGSRGPSFSEVGWS